MHQSLSSMQVLIEISGNCISLNRTVDDIVHMLYVKKDGWYEV